jgi:hypothetical protein
MAGDVGEVFANIGLVLASLASRFARVIWAPGNRKSAALRTARAAGVLPADEGRLHADPYPSVADWCRDRVTATESRLAEIVGPTVLAAVYGHLHIPRTSYHDGVRFEEVSVGYPREWRRRGAAPPLPRVILGGTAS